MRALAFCGICGLAVTANGQGVQISKIEAVDNYNFTQIKNAPPMKWVCPEVEKYQSLLNTLRDDDYKVYAKNVMGHINLASKPGSQDEKYLITQAAITIKDPLYTPENVLNHVAAWVKKYKGWGKSVSVNTKDNNVTASASINVATHTSFMNINKVYVTPTMIAHLVAKDTLLVTFLVNQYKNDECYKSDGRVSMTYTPKISDVYPFNEKSPYKITYAKAYVGTYIYFWKFIYDLRDELNNHFVCDEKLLNQLHYAYQKDSLLAKYGEPTKVIDGTTVTPNVNKEIHFYEKAQKMLVMGTTIDFKDIMSCEIVDDPKFIPGRSTTSGLGFSFFGIGIGGAETTRTADKTIHNYVVNIKIDNMKNPLVRIATGQDENKAEEIASTVEYILRHQQDQKGAKTQKTTVTRRIKR